MKFVTVYRADNETEATMVRDFLEDQGIPAKLSSQVPASVYGLSLQEVEVQAPQEREDQARELIEAYFSAAPQIDQTDLPDD